MMKNKYAQTIYVWKSFDPRKKLEKFTFRDFDSFSDIISWQFKKDEIILINNTFFVNMGSKTIYLSEKKESVVKFFDKRKLIAEIPA